MSVVSGLALLTAGCAGAKPGTRTTAAQGSPAESTKATPTVALPGAVPTTASKHATLRLESTWMRCHEGFAPGADAASEVKRLAEQCAAMTKMHAVTAFVGDQSASGKPQTFHWKAAAGHCYRAYGVGATGIKNLDLLMIDSSGAALGQDGSDDRAPVILDAGAVCFTADDDAALIVSVGDGSGAFAVTVWGD